jgi:hypothetical protein
MPQPLWPQVGDFTSAEGVTGYRAAIAASLSAAGGLGGALCGVDSRGWLLVVHERPGRPRNVGVV